MAFIYQTRVNCLRLCVCFFSRSRWFKKRGAHEREGRGYHLVARKTGSDYVLERSCCSRLVPNAFNVSLSN